MSAAITPKSSWTAGSLPIGICAAPSFRQPIFRSALPGTCTPHCTGFSKPFGLNQPWRHRVNQQTRSSVDLLARPLGTTGSLPERAGLERARSISASVKDYGIVLDL